jgi:hypothetical protein
MFRINGFPTLTEYDFFTFVLKNPKVLPAGNIVLARSNYPLHGYSNSGRLHGFSANRRKDKAAFIFEE